MSSVTGLINAFLTVALLWCIHLIVLSGLRVFAGSANRMDYVFVAIALVGSVLCVTALLSRSRLKGRVALGFASTMFTLFSVELLIALCLALFPPITSRAAYAERLGVPFDARTWLEVFEDLQRKNVLAVSHFHSCWWLRAGRDSDSDAVFPLAGSSNATTVYGNEGGEYLIYTSDRHGFNNPADLWDPAKVEVALIGDSFTAGAYVEPSKNIAGVLQSAGYSVINFGVGGAGPLLSLASLKEYATGLRPPVVVWIYYEGNDLGDLEFEKQSTRLLRYLHEDYSQNLIERQEEVDRAVFDFIEEAKIRAEANRGERQRLSIRNSLPARILRLSHVRDIRKHVSSYSYDPYFQPAEPHPDIGLFGEILSEARRVTESWGGVFWFVYLTDYHRYSQRVDHESFYSRAEVLAEVNRLRIPIIDFHTPVSQLADPLDLFPLRVSGHYTEEGYRIVADEIRRHLLKSQ